MATKKAAKKATSGKPTSKPKKKLEPGDPIIINGGGGLIKIRDKKVELQFDHNAWGPDENDPNRWINEDCSLLSIGVFQIGNDLQNYPLNASDAVTLKSSKGGANSDVQITGSRPTFLKFNLKDYPYKKKKHTGAGFQIDEVLVNNRSVWRSQPDKDCIIAVSTKK